MGYAFEKYQFVDQKPSIVRKKYYKDKNTMGSKGFVGWTESCSTSSISTKTSCSSLLERCVFFIRVGEFLFLFDVFFFTRDLPVKLSEVGGVLRFLEFDVIEIGGWERGTGEGDFVVTKGEDKIVFRVGDRFMFCNYEN